jgi:hypothetical protein
MSKGGYTGGSTVIGPGSSWFSKPKKIKKPTEAELSAKAEAKAVARQRAEEARTRAEMRRAEKERARLETLAKQREEEADRQKKQQELKARFSDPKHLQEVEKKMTLQDVRRRGIEVEVRKKRNRPLSPSTGK